MSEMLVIVESPAKAKTIGKFLGSKYKVVASNGHVRDLPKSQLGVDVEHDFGERCWIISAGRPRPRKRYISQPTLIWKVKPYPGILHIS